MPPFVSPILPLWLLLISPFVGSFLALLVDRLPRAETWVAGRSACRSCGAALGVRDLLPVVSYALARGRCRHCGAPIPPVLLYMEIAAPGLALLAVIAAPGWAASPGWAMALGCLSLWLLLALGVADWLWMRLPDVLTAALLVSAVALAWARAPSEVWPALLAAAAGSGAFALIRVGYRLLRGREGLGLGDVKLMAGLGALVGPYDLPLLVLLGALVGLALAGARSLRDGVRPDRTTALPFGTALCLAAGALWIWQQIV